MTVQDLYQELKRLTETGHAGTPVYVKDSDFGEQPVGGTTITTLTTYPPVWTEKLGHTSGLRPPTIETILLIHHGPV